MTGFLSSQSVRAGASAKAILVGEHAAVFGYPALAVALPDVGLDVELLAPESQQSLPQTWSEAFEMYVRGEKVELSEQQRGKLVEALSRALNHTGADFSLDDFRPQPINIDSQIPLGAGMGGSAALSTALVRLVDNVRGRTSNDLATRANEIDCVFHGVASGLDTAAIAAGGTVIEFARNKGAKAVYHKTGFWVVLVDSGERAATFDMVEKIKISRELSQSHVDTLMQTLGDISERARTHLEMGDVLSLGRELDAAHIALARLGVSTEKLDGLVSALRKAGAAGAKLTGAGGGGVVLGLFSDDPVSHLQELSKLGQVYYSKIATKHQPVMSL